MGHTNSPHKRYHLTWDFCSLLQIMKTIYFSLFIIVRKITRKLLGFFFSLLNYTVSADIKFIFQCCLSSDALSKLNSVCSGRFAFPFPLYSPLYFTGIHSNVQWSPAETYLWKLSQPPA